MNPEFAVEIIKMALLQALTLMAPIVGASMVVGLGVSLFQAVTSIHEQTLTFVPKLGVIVGVTIVALPWLARSMIEFTRAMFEKIPQMVY